MDTDYSEQLYNWANLHAWGMFHSKVIMEMMKANSHDISLLS